MKTNTKITLALKDSEKTIQQINAYVLSICPNVKTGT